ncbi:MAG: restriction endonuclease subunit S [Candidatus Nitrosopolaris sp.]
MAKVKIPLPPISEQKKVATILDKAHEIRQKIQLATDTLNQLLNAVFNEMFGDPAINPLEWNTYTLGELAEIRGGIPLCKDRRPLNNPRPYLTVRNVYAGYLSLSDIRYVEINDNELLKWVLKAGDLLILEGNGGRTNVGRTAIFRGEMENCVHQNHVFRVRFRNSVVLPTFATTYLNSPQIKSKFFELARTTAGINTINMGQLKSLTMYCPPVELQEEFGKVANIIDMIKIKQECLQRMITRIIDSITDKLFRSSE